MSETRQGRQLKILLVDDEENILRALKRLLMEEPVEILLANSGAEGLELLKQHEDVALIVSDQRMPGLSGAEFLEQAKVLVPHALRIVLTGYADIKATVDAINRGGAYRYIAKPWNDEEFLQIIQEAVQRYVLEDENRRLTHIVNQQNEELKGWNKQLQQRVLQRTADVRKKNDELAQAYSQLKGGLHQMLGMVSSLLELRNPFLRDHSRNVAELAVAVGQACSMTDAELNTLHIAALLHDVGKIGMQDGLIEMDWDQLGQEQLPLYQQHSVWGQTVLDGVQDLRDAGLLIRHHHEFFAGGGFPDGIEGDAIPLGSRIIALVDYYDHVQRKAGHDKGLEMALAAVKGDRGRRFDYRLIPKLEMVVNRDSLTDTSSTEEPNPNEQFLYPMHLREGMVVVENLYSGTGLLLVAKGVCLDEWKILALSRYYRIDPPTGPVHVMLPEES